MNWPALTAECSSAVDEALRNAVREKPQDLFEYVAKQLSDKSGLDPTTYESHFEECKRKPRVYVLEEFCPPTQDPFSWVPMRYKDDTILSMLEHKALKVIDEILSPTPVPDLKEMDVAVIAAYPELMYVRGCAEETMACQALRALHFLCSASNNETLFPSMKDADAQLTFHCEEMVSKLRGSGLCGSVIKDSVLLDALIVCQMLTVVGGHEGFRQRYGGEQGSPADAILYAVEHEAKALPSYRRLNDLGKKLVVAALRGHVPLAQVIVGESTPAHHGVAKEVLLPLGEDGLKFFVASLMAGHILANRETLVMDEDAQLVLLAAQSFLDIERASPQRACELYLKRRAEKHSWRLIKDDHPQRALVRLCCLAKSENPEVWNSLQSAYLALDDASLQLLSVELGRKDGILDFPVIVPHGASGFVSGACAEGGAGAEAALQVLVKVLSIATGFVSGNEKVIRLDFTGISECLSANGALIGVPFEEMPLNVGWAEDVADMCVYLEGR
eukprot:TRINITY_DN9308_c3_g1_i1.p1 TRINITY_DN9308_c3_g1~~TRINITY_DN9308_c3_g1_i1.p1  ORF type:complete len:502 (+),score=101.24 TRINITY_DN9308_c3_g1_i1:1777-3282(+)